MKTLKSYIKLCKVTISFFAACSVATGFILSPSTLTPAIIAPLIGVFLLACGSSALNQYQERDIDGRMERTRHRPIPAGDISSPHALMASLILITSGLLLIYRGGTLPLGLGLGAVFWYNGVYTSLKKKTSFAAVPGALVGAIPPAIGWISGGGTLLDARLFALCALFFMWQIPHFWLLLLNHGDEYEQAGLPSPTRILTKQQLARITFVWIASTAVANLALPLYGMLKWPAVYLALISSALWLVVTSARLFRIKTAPVSYLPLFKRINVYILLVMALLSLDRFLDKAV